MTHIFKSKNSTTQLLKFLIPKVDENTNNEWVEITINKSIEEFTAKKVILKEISDEWEICKDYTFPSSLLNEFLNSDQV